MSSSRIPSTRYLLQVWPEESSQGHEWRGKVHHLSSGEARYFRDWGTMLEFLDATLAQLGAADGSPFQDGEENL